MGAVEIHNSVFEFAKANSIAPKDLFGEMYQALLKQDRGPKLGKLIHALSVKKVKEDLGI